jgi:hypothetical protein
MIHMDYDTIQSCRWLHFRGTVVSQLITPQSLIFASIKSQLIDHLSYTHIRYQKFNIADTKNPELKYICNECHGLRILELGTVLVNKSSIF